MGRPGEGVPRNDHLGDNESGPHEALTCIHECIHYTATPSATDDDELQQIQVQHFLDTLVEVALAIVRRKDQLDR